MMPVTVRIASASDAELLDFVTPGVFDLPVDPKLRDEFLRDPRHHLCIALDGDRVVGMASAVHYVHPDKPRQLWINEVGVIESHRNQGIGKMLVRALLHLACELNCSEAWVLTDRENQIAQRLYSTCGGEPREQVMFTFKLERESR